ncbi:MAG TPA: phosphocholine cytidylyltransferase family protein [Dehalococcoidia bacterium]|jgi:choline kinase|nr:phosphocholine cytidylyltransferase family protein [Dehalococcoidia bacterium]
MIALLLAAGRGRRLGSERPKALLEFGGRTLLDRHLENLASLRGGIEGGIETVVVTGFRAELLDVPRAIHNSRYERGSVISLAVALDALASRKDDLLLMDADVLYEPSILRDVTALDRGFAIDTRVTPGSEEMMAGVRDGQVRALRRGHLEGFALTGENVGFAKIDAASLPALRAIVAEVEAADADSDYEDALDRFVATHGADYVLVGDRAWTEIDFAEDVERAEQEVLGRLDGGQCWAARFSRTISAEGISG